MKHFEYLDHSHYSHVNKHNFEAHVITFEFQWHGIFDNMNMCFSIICCTIPNTACPGVFRDLLHLKVGFWELVLDNCGHVLLGCTDKDGQDLLAQLHKCI